MCINIYIYMFFFSYIYIELLLDGWASGLYICLTAITSEVWLFA